MLHILWTTYWACNNVIISMLSSPSSSVSCFGRGEYAHKNHEKNSRFAVARAGSGQFWKMGYHFEAHVNPDSKENIGSLNGPLSTWLIGPSWGTYDLTNKDIHTKLFGGKVLTDEKLLDMCLNCIQPIIGNVFSPASLYLFHCSIRNRLLGR